MCPMPGAQDYVDLGRIGSDQCVCDIGSFLSSSDCKKCTAGSSAALRVVPAVEVLGTGLTHLGEEALGEPGTQSTQMVNSQYVPAEVAGAFEAADGVSYRLRA
ncbi:hypothetical protein GUITHDRAFT_109755 [Guillardia theta CCMP2712]|uniref:Uncharacterized protein n=1 Tax=Guillardia theta (strain CCMP2712) TaxID=905079 RepID=L1J8B5_GUITC|nr:hypothetical protein GUITHDRAFT_109755 [Guillardia theta CCMP2712]EKX44300.1 hypothetical protein GUITHDRAFT_109755 [Guillardia theta CCMP2712]|eukprot:XP_005831280.1 hypothetical protein GUITHDRAFT_109755 [Guillardia theta CCMP2712]